MVRVGELGDSRNNTWDNFARAIALRREAEQLILGQIEQPPVNPQTVRDGRRQWLSLMENAATADQLAGRGQWSSACDQYIQLVDQPAFDWEVWELRQSVLAQQVGAVFLKAADTVRHEALCRALLTRTNSHVPSMLRERYAVVNLVRTSHLPPELVSQAIVQARTAFEESEARGDRWRVLVQILAEYRSGQ